MHDSPAGDVALPEYAEPSKRAHRFASHTASKPKDPPSVRLWGTRGRISSPVRSSAYVSHGAIQGRSFRAVSPVRGSSILPAAIRRTGRTPSRPCPRHRNPSRGDCPVGQRIQTTFCVRQGKPYETACHPARASRTAHISRIGKTVRLHLHQRIRRRTRPRSKPCLDIHCHPWIRETNVDVPSCHAMFRNIPLPLAGAVLRTLQSRASGAGEWTRPTTLTRTTVERKTGWPSFAHLRCATAWPSCDALAQPLGRQDSTTISVTALPARRSFHALRTACPPTNDVHAWTRVRALLPCSVLRRTSRQMGIHLPFPGDVQASLHQITLPRCD